MNTLLSQTAYTKALRIFRSIQNLSHYCYTCSSRPKVLEHLLSHSLYFLFYSYNFLDAVFINILKLKKVVATIQTSIYIYIYIYIYLKPVSDFCISIKFIQILKPCLATTQILLLSVYTSPRVIDYGNSMRDISVTFRPQYLRLLER